jgi:hypothetical protein
MSGTTESRVRAILADPYSQEWSIQGFGMLRTWLDPEGVERLHIWDAEGSANEDVSTLHNHPWDFESRIAFGRLLNQRYDVAEMEGCPEGQPYLAAPILTGAGGHLLGPPRDVAVADFPAEYYRPGDAYAQGAEEYHESFPSAGTVTIIRRTFKYERHATVCWPRGGQWVSAEPRPATRAEVDRFIALAAARM